MQQSGNSSKPYGIFTTAVPLPAATPLTCCTYPSMFYLGLALILQRYYHYPIAIPKLVANGYWRRSTTLFELTQQYKLQVTTHNRVWHPLKESDVAGATMLLNKHLSVSEYA